MLAEKHNRPAEPNHSTDPKCRQQALDVSTNIYLRHTFYISCIINSLALPWRPRIRAEFLKGGDTPPATAHTAIYLRRHGNQLLYPQSDSTWDPARRRPKTRDGILSV